MYEVDDPRSSMHKKAAADAATGAARPGFAAAEYVKFYERGADESSAGADTWYGRGQNFVVAYTRARTGAVLERPAQLDEYMLALPERGAGVRITAGNETLDVPGHSLVVVPPGASRVELRQDAQVLRVFTTRNADVASRASNASAYDEPHPHIPPFAAWPEPVGGYRIRAYDLDVPEQPGRFGRLFRCTTMMINMLPFEPAPRDVTRLSPHHHEDFEQGSFALAGAFMHHIRWPWTANQGHWRDDDHELCGSPSLAVIPPPAIHTSAATQPEGNQLIDIFSPPRFDFSKMQGWVLNAADYPMPAAAPGDARG
jgi:hypothetical protein